MKSEDLASAIEKLQTRIKYLSAKMKTTKDSAEKGMMKEELDNIQKQIEILQRYYAKS